MKKMKKLLLTLAVVPLLSVCVPPLGAHEHGPDYVALPKDDVGIKVQKYEGIITQRYTEIFLIGGNRATQELIGGVYNSIGLNDPEGKGDTAPPELLDNLDLKGLAKENHVIASFKNGPRLWTLDWLEVETGYKRDFQGLEAHWVMWLDVPKHLGESQDKLSYKPMHGKRNTHMGINAGSRVYLLDDPEGNTYCMKSASLITDPHQSYESLKDLGSRLTPAKGWKFRTKILDKDLVFTPDHGKAIICQDDFGNTYDRVGGAYSNYKP